MEEELLLEELLQNGATEDVEMVGGVDRTYFCLALARATWDFIVVKMDDIGKTEVMREGLTQAMEFLLEMCNAFDTLLECQTTRPRGKLVSTSTVRYAVEALIARRCLVERPNINLINFSNDENDSIYTPSEDSDNEDDDWEPDSLFEEGFTARDSRDDSVLIEADFDGSPIAFSSHVVLVYFRWHAEHAAPYEPLAITRNALRVFGLLLERWLHAFLEHRYPQYQRWNRRRHAILGRTALLRGRHNSTEANPLSKEDFFFQTSQDTTSTPPRRHSKKTTIFSTPNSASTTRITRNITNQYTPPNNSILSSRSVPFRGRTVRPRSSRSDSLLNFVATLPDTVFQQIILFL